jgi:hypothetical protein
MTSLEQAQELQRRVVSCKNELHYYDNFRKEITEEEVLFRFNSLHGILIMAINDINELVNVWLQGENYE